MKQVAAIIMIVIMFMLSLGAFAYDTLNLNREGATVEEKMVSFETITVPMEKQIEELEGRMEYIFSQYGYDLKTMNVATLTELIQTQKKYATGKEILIDGLNQVYFAEYTQNQVPVTQRLSKAVITVTKNCRLIDKIASRCLDKQESLVFQAHYLKLQIEELNTTQASLTNQINTLIAQQNNSLYL